MEEQVDRAGKVFVAAAMLCAFVPRLVVALFGLVIPVSAPGQAAAHISRFAFWLLLAALMVETVIYDRRRKVGR